MKQKHKPLSWKPVLKGEIYCSPACGGGCLRSAYEIAQEKADRLCQVLGKNWKPKVWENLGWHYCAYLGSGFMSVSEYNGKYSCMLADGIDSKFCGSILWDCYPNKHFKNPKDAVKHTLELAQKTISELNLVVETARKLTK